ncbi:hypothetical protein ACOME3_005754 [Neoechinorhynchus agilis]
MTRGDTIHETEEEETHSLDYEENEPSPHSGEDQNDVECEVLNEEPTPKERLFSIFIPEKKRRSRRSRSRRSIASRWRSTGYNQKAIITLGVVLGCFCICWFPFFINALVKPAYKHLRGKDISSPVWLDPFLLWLGYLSPLLNPIIYSFFNKEFRRPFKEVLLCRCKGLNTRMNRYVYSRQFGNTQSI